MNADVARAIREQLVLANFAVYSNNPDAALQSIEAAKELISPHCLKPPSLFATSKEHTTTPGGTA